MDTNSCCATALLAMQQIVDSRYTCVLKHYVIEFGTECFLMHVVPLFTELPSYGVQRALPAILIGNYHNSRSISQSGPEKTSECS